MTKRFRGLNEAQSRVFGLITIHQDGGHHPATLKALESRGLIQKQIVEYPAKVGGVIRVTRWIVPTPVHMDWCEWCSRAPEMEDAP